MINELDIGIKCHRVDYTSVYSTVTSYNYCNKNNAGKLKIMIVIIMRFQIVNQQS